MNIRGWLTALLLLLGLLATPAVAHEVRPAYLEMRQLDAESYDVLWKVPGLGEDKRLSLDVLFPSGTAMIDPPRMSFVNNAFVERSRVKRDGGFDGTSIRIAGLEATLSDVLVRIERLDGTTRTLRVMPASPEFVIEAEPGRWEVAQTYLGLGVEHILLGFDHLCFVLALMLIVRGTSRLIWTVTAFTLAHSITLALATLGVVHVPGPPVEAVIALSIVFIASEIVQQQRGREGLAAKRPWLVAFVFGLLHGVGFAGALAEVGLPQNSIPLALLFFNIGVEAGQLLFIAAVLTLAAVLTRLTASRPELRRAAIIPAYGIGGIASFWAIERISGFWG